MPHEKYQRCVHTCIVCIVACEHCASECLREQDVTMMARCIELDRDCADTCALAVRLMARGSEFAMRFCALCAEVCDACAAECGKHSAEHCKKCAEACRQCAEECRKMAA